MSQTPEKRQNNAPIIGKQFTEQLQDELGLINEGNKNPAISRNFAGSTASLLCDNSMSSTTPKSIKVTIEHAPLMGDFDKMLDCDNGPEISDAESTGSTDEWNKGITRNAEAAKTDLIVRQTELD